MDLDSGSAMMTCANTENAAGFRTAEVRFHDRLDKNKVSDSAVTCLQNYPPCSNLLRGEVLR